MLLVILGILLGLALLLVALLAVPVDLVFAVYKTGRVRASLRYRWLMGAVQGGVLPRRGRPAVKRREEVSPEEELRPVTRRRDHTRWLRYARILVRVEGLLTRGVRLVREIVRGIQVRDLMLDLRFGLDDPADTGELFGSLCPVLIPIESLTKSSVRVQPEFDGLVLAGAFRGELRVIPLRVVASLLAFGCSGPALRAGRAVLRERSR